MSKSKKVVVLFSNPQNPPLIRTTLSGLSPSFVSAEEKKVLERLKEINPESVLMDGICPKVAGKVMKAFPETKTLYVGGTKEQLRNLPTGAVILDNWMVARENISTRN